jgi:NAD(P)-dependent dehydrogenase (short-subunit alcohol dehydrogenase family)
MVSAESMTEQELRDEVAAVPLGRIAQPAEIAAAVAFLAGPDAAYFTGQCISPNGGAVMF